MIRSKDRSFICNIVFFAIVSGSFSSPLQRFSYYKENYDLLSKMIYPYFSCIYNRTTPTTVIQFPDWEYNDSNSFLIIGKKDDKATFFNDLYFSGQYNGRNNIYGLHLDKINISNSHSDDTSGFRVGTDSYEFDGRDNEARFSIWCSLDKHRIFKGFSGSVDFRSIKDYSKRYDYESDSSWLFYEREFTNKDFNVSLMSVFDFFKRGSIRMELELKRIKYNSYSHIEYADTMSSNEDSSKYKEKYTGFSLGYLLNLKGNRTFFTNIGYATLYYIKEMDFDYEDETKLFFETYLSNKHSVKNLDIYWGIGGYVQYWFFIPRMDTLSFFDRFKRYSKDKTEYDYYLFFPVFLEYKVSSKFTLFSHWKPYFYHVKNFYISNSYNESRISNSLYVYESGLGLSYRISDKLKLTLMPYFNGKTQLTGMDFTLSF